MPFFKLKHYLMTTLYIINTRPMNRRSAQACCISARAGFLAMNRSPPIICRYS